MLYAEQHKPCLRERNASLGKHILQPTTKSNLGDGMKPCASSPTKVKTLGSNQYVAGPTYHLQIIIGAW